MVPRDPLREKWSKQIRFTRDYHELTQVQFGRLLGVTGQTVSHWERALTLPPAQYRSILMKMFAQAEAETVDAEDGPAA